MRGRTSRGAINVNRAVDEAINTPVRTEGGPADQIVSECVGWFDLGDKGEARAKYAWEMKVEERVILWDNETFVIVVAQDHKPNDINGESGREKHSKCNMLGS